MTHCWLLKKTNPFPSTRWKAVHQWLKHLSSSWLRRACGAWPRDSPLALSPPCQPPSSSSSAMKRWRGSACGLNSSTPGTGEKQGVVQDTWTQGWFPPPFLMLHFDILTVDRSGFERYTCTAQAGFWDADQTVQYVRLLCRILQVQESIRWAMMFHAKKLTQIKSQHTCRSSVLCIYTGWFKPNLFVKLTNRTAL